MCLRQRDRNRKASIQVKPDNVQKRIGVNLAKYCESPSQSIWSVTPRTAMLGWAWKGNGSGSATDVYRVGYKENAVCKKAEFLKYVNGIKGSNAKEL